MKKGFTSRSRLGASRHTFFITLGIIAIVVIICFTGLSVPGVIELKGIKDINYGIDIRGGFEAYLVPASSHTGPVKKSDLEVAKNVVAFRLDSQNVTDREIYIDGSDRIIVRAPLQASDEKDKTNEIFELLGEMALLTFKDPDGKVVLQGNDVVKAIPSVDDNEYIVVLSLSKEGGDKFAEATGRLIGKNISIYMDDTMISNPNVKNKITGGEAIITGMANVKEAKDLAEKIQAGSLPFAMEVISKNIVSASLGNRALDTMINAGLLSLLLICIFMILFYKLPGFVAVIALTAQLCGQLLAISIPGFTLTLPGIAAIILSMGMGVDANIIIAERIKEEIRGGNTLKISIRNGFDRAFSAVIDGNITTAISAVLLMIFGSGTFLSFGYSLLTGVILNILCGVFANRLMTNSLSQYNAFSNNWLYGGKKVKA